MPPTTLLKLRMLVQGGLDLEEIPWELRSEPFAHGSDVNARPQNAQRAYYADASTSMTLAALQMPGSLPHSPNCSRVAIQSVMRGVDPQLLRCVLAHPGIAVNREHRELGTLLCMACTNGNETAVKALLLRDDLDINHFDPMMGTALSAAIRQHRFDVIRLLLDDPRIDVNARDVKGTALCTAAQYGDKLSVGLLLAHAQKRNIRLTHMGDAWTLAGGTGDACKGNLILQHFSPRDMLSWQFIAIVLVSDGMIKLCALLLLVFLMIRWSF